MTKYSRQYATYDTGQGAKESKNPAFDVDVQNDWCDLVHFYFRPACHTTFFFLAFPSVYLMSSRPHPTFRPNGSTIYTRKTVVSCVLTNHLSIHSFIYAPEVGFVVARM